MDVPPPGYEQTVEAIVKCGIPRPNIRIAYQDYLQSDEIRISDLGSVNDEKLGCLKSAVHPFYILTLENDVQQLAFYDFSERVSRPKRKAEAREWLRSKGLLERLPKFDPEKGVKDFAAAIEVACGLEVGSALLPDGNTQLTIRPEIFSGNDYAKSGEVLLCLSRMIEASNADQYSVHLGFIGNEAVVEPKDK